MRVFSLVLLMTCCGGLAACNDEEPFDEAADRARLAKLETGIDDLIGEAVCKDGKDCRVIAFGAKPCGGPWSYKVFSASAVDTTALAGLVDDYNKFNRTLNDRYGWMSDCAVVMPPNVGCVEGRCVVVE
jgi:hypothetical protein